jgi:hypothetical protein
VDDDPAGPAVRELQLADVDPGAELKADLADRLHRGSSEPHRRRGLAEESEQSISGGIYFAPAMRFQQPPQDLKLALEEDLPPFVPE